MNPELIAQLLDATNLVHGPSNHREIKSPLGANIAVDHLAEMERHIKGQLRLAGPLPRRIDGIIPPYSFQCRQEGRLASFALLTGAVSGRENGKKAVAEEFQDFTAILD